MNYEYIIARLRRNPRGVAFEFEHQCADAIEQLSLAYRRATVAVVTLDDGSEHECSGSVAAAYGIVRSERDALHADAERYRWIRNSLNLGRGHARIWRQDVAQNVVMANEELDAAIDAALGKKEEKS